MSISMTLDHPAIRTPAWHLWIDCCGGYALIPGQRWSIGGARPGGDAMIRVQSDWRRSEGQIVRHGSDYFWQPRRKTDRSPAGENLGERQWLHPGRVIPIPGSVQLRLDQPSPLSATAVLVPEPPHRLDSHVDAAVLVDQIVQIGPGADNHIRCGQLDAAAVLVFRDGRWKAKPKPGRDVSSGDRSGSGTSGGQPGAANRFVDLVCGQRISVGSLDMTLEQA